MLQKVILHPNPLWGVQVISSTSAPALPSVPAWQSLSWLHETSVFGACPLCGYGEFGNEHLLLWCPAVRGAWSRLDHPAGLGLIAALSSVAAAPPAHTGTFLHQVGFLAATLAGSATLEWPRAAALLVRATRDTLHDFVPLPQDPDDLDAPLSPPPPHMC